MLIVTVKEKGLVPLPKKKSSPPALRSRARFNWLMKSCYLGNRIMQQQGAEKQKSRSRTKQTSVLSKEYPPATPAKFAGTAHSKRPISKKAPKKSQ